MSKCKAVLDSDKITEIQVLARGQEAQQPQQADEQVESVEDEEAS